MLSSKQVVSIVTLSPQLMSHSSPLFSYCAMYMYAQFSIYRNVYTHQRSRTPYSICVSLYIYKGMLLFRLKNLPVCRMCIKVQRIGRNVLWELEGKKSRKMKMFLKKEYKDIRIRFYIPHFFIWHACITLKNNFISL